MVDTRASRTLKMVDTRGSRTLKRVVRTKKHSKAAEVPFLPDELIENILSRLPVKKVINFSLVCKKWGAITTDQCFAYLHRLRNNSLPLLIVLDFFDHSPRGFLDLWDKWWRSSKAVQSFPFYCITLLGDDDDPLISQGGLIVFYELKQSQKLLCIFNPMYPAQVVQIILSRVLRNSPILGVFFHPSLNEYCALFRIQETDEPQRGQPYMMLTLGSEPSLKTVTVSELVLDKVQKKTLHALKVLLIGPYLYWLLESEHDDDDRKGLNDIMRFDTKSEEFFIIDCPVPLDTKCWCDQTHILDIDGILSYILVSPRKITIWRLKDEMEHLWTSKEYISEKAETFPFGVDHAIAVVKEQFAFFDESKLYVCDLKKGKVTCRRQMKETWTFVGLPLQMGLASLSNCKTPIFIEQDQDNKVVCTMTSETSKSKRLLLCL